MILGYTRVKNMNSAATGIFIAEEMTI